MNFEKQYQSCELRGSGSIRSRGNILTIRDEGCLEILCWKWCEENDRPARMLTLSIPFALLF